MDNELRPYDEYKRTDLLWLDSIPEHWEMTRNKNVMMLSKDTVGKNHSNYVLLSLTKNGIIARDMENAKGKFPKEFDTYQVVNPGDIVFCLFDIDETPRTVGLSSKKGMITGAYTIFKIENINPKYLYYYYLSIDNNKKLKPLYTGLRKVINTDTFLRTKMPNPPRDEQDKIVKFLDFQISKINKFIKIKTKLISALNEQKQAIINEVVTKGINPNVKMKPSGIEWLGDIPEHWTVLLNKRIFRENSRSYSGVGEIPLSLSQKDGLIISTEMKEKSLQTSTYDNWKIVLKNDLVLNRFKAHLGVFFASTLRGVVTFHYGVYEPQVELESKYYEHLYHTNAYRTIYAGRSNGMTVGLQNLSNQNFYNVYTIFPPVEEQRYIIEYIDKEIKKVDKIIEEVQQEINLIAEYRATLISDVVTGKVDVRNIVIDDILEEDTEIDETEDEIIKSEEDINIGESED